MSYLLTQMFLYMIATFLLGLILGWLFWRYGKASGDDYDALQARFAALTKERDDLKVNLDACRNRSAQERETLEALRADKIDLQNRLDGAAVRSTAMPAAAVPVSTFSGVATKPEGLPAARGGRPDPLQEISGVGPKLEQMLHDMGYYHFDQIANWSTAEVAWVDDNLEGFKGRVSRDEWISQAKVLARR